MQIQVDAVHESGALRPPQPLDSREHEHIVSVVKADPAEMSRNPKGSGGIYRTPKGGPDLWEVLRLLAEIPGSMAAKLTARRGVS
jgi:hypothetical protein